MTTFEEANRLQARATAIVREHVDSKLDRSDPPVAYDVFVVWFSKTLRNWKALVSTTLPDQMYYELTHDGHNRVTYLDAYKKFENRAIPDED